MLVIIFNAFLCKITIVFSLLKTDFNNVCVVTVAVFNGKCSWMELFMLTFIIIIIWRYTVKILMELKMRMEHFKFNKCSKFSILIKQRLKCACIFKSIFYMLKLKYTDQISITIYIHIHLKKTYFILLVKFQKSDF